MIDNSIPNLSSSAAAAALVTFLSSCSPCRSLALAAKSPAVGTQPLRGQATSQAYRDRQIPSHPPTFTSRKPSSEEERQADLLLDRRLLLAANTTFTNSSFPPILLLLFKASEPESSASLQSQKSDTNRPQSDDSQSSSSRAFQHHPSSSSSSPLYQPFLQPIASDLLQPTTRKNCHLRHHHHHIGNIVVPL